MTKKYNIQKSSGILLSLLIIRSTLLSSVNAAPIISDVSLSQVNWLRPDSSVAAANSVWGDFSFSVIPDESDTFFLNLVTQNAGTSAWSVQNLPLTPFTSGNQSVDIDLQELGITPGADLTQIEVLVSIDTMFRETTPSGSFNLLNVTDLDRLTCEVNDIEGEFNPGRPQGIKLNSPPIGNPRPVRNFLPLQEDNNGCFPGSMARSIDWLNRTKNLGSSKTITDFYRDLVRLTGLPPNAPAEELRIQNKAIFVKDLGINTKVFDAVGILDPIPMVPETTPMQIDTLSWLWQEFTKGEDIEIAYTWRDIPSGETGAHIVAIVDMFRTANGQKIVRYRDDDDQGNPAVGDNSIKWAELIPKPDGTIGFKTGANTLTYAVSESVKVPEPISTIGFLALGILGSISSLNRKLNSSRSLDRKR